jgi:uncharacterized ParB-like nuclease family protein
MNEHSAIQNFYRARRRAGFERLLAWLRGRPADLVCFRQVRDRVAPEASRRHGIQEIPLEAIVGSLGRCDDYTREFMPLKDSDRERWAGVMEAVVAARDLPPIRVYRVSDIYFVIDGHHRVSVARQLGWTHIKARVVEIPTTAPPGFDSQPSLTAGVAL